MEHQVLDCRPGIHVPGHGKPHKCHCLHKEGQHSTGFRYLKKTARQAHGSARSAALGGDLAPHIRADAVQKLGRYVLGNDLLGSR